MSSVILLHPQDNILVCVAPIAAGDKLVIDGAVVAATGPVGVGHKIARASLAAGERVIKYGAPIGSLTTPVPLGGWVHTHNMKSDYIASHGRHASPEGSG